MYSGYHHRFKIFWAYSSCDVILIIYPLFEDAFPTYPIYALASTLVYMAT
ncbi:MULTISPECIES: hypothetical protein [unclassified Exiguobacterium]|nr:MULTISPECIES: hypothetical protein [unclassified Exiguobacterium]